MSPMGTRTDRYGRQTVSRPISRPLPSSAQRRCPVRPGSSSHHSLATRGTSCLRPILTAQLLTTPPASRPTRLGRPARRPSSSHTQRRRRVRRGAGSAVRHLPHDRLHGGRRSREVGDSQPVRKGPIFAWNVPGTTSGCRGIPAKAGPRASVATSGFGRAGSSEWLNLIGNLFAGRDVIAMIGT